MIYKMHFQVIEDNYYNGILEKIDSFFPSFCPIFDKEDGVYPILGELSTYIIENFELEEIRQSTIAFINEAIEQGGTKTEDAIVLQLFQKFYEDDKLTNQIRKQLNHRTLDVFENFFKEYND